MLGRCIDVAGSTQHDSFGRNDDRAVELGNFLDSFTHAGIIEIAFLAIVAAYRIEPGRMAAGHYLTGVADDEERADRLSLAAFAADFDCHVDDGFQRIERDEGFQLAQVACRELAQVFPQMDDADRVVNIGLEPAVDGDHFGAGARTSSATASSSAWVSFSWTGASAIFSTTAASPRSVAPSSCPR